MKEESTKKYEYVEAAYQMILEEGMSNVSIRKLAKRIGCSSAVLYKHFDNLEYLLVLASIRFLDTYIRKFVHYKDKRDEDPLEYNLILWKVFIEEAFRNPEPYKVLFCGKYSDYFAEAVNELYRLDPSMKDFFAKDALSTLIMMGGDLTERDFTLLRLAVKDGRLTYEEAELLSTVNVMVFRGYLDKALEHTDDEAVREKLGDECYGYIEMLVKQFSHKK